MSAKTITLDVREDIRNGREPFSKIMGAVAALTDSQQLLLVAPFEPKPLFSVLARQGFHYAVREISAAHWEVRLTRTSPPAMQSAVAPRRSVISSEPSEILSLDARGLEPPQPMIRILEALETLPEDAELRAQTDRRPIHLYAHLAERGFIGESEEQNDGCFITHIRRA